MICCTDIVMTPSLPVIQRSVLTVHKYWWHIETVLSAWFTSLLIDESGQLAYSHVVCRRMVFEHSWLVKSMRESCTTHMNVLRSGDFLLLLYISDKVLAH